MLNLSEELLYKEKIEPIRELRPSYKMGRIEQEIMQIRLAGRQVPQSYNLVNPIQQSVF
jgi:hypothetical protein